MRRVRNASILLILAIAAGCGPKFRHGMVLEEPAPFRENEYRDDTIYVRFSPGPDSIHIHVYNRSKRPVRLDWRRAQYVDLNGTSHQLYIGTPTPSTLDKAPTVSTLQADRAVDTEIYPRDLLSAKVLREQYGKQGPVVVRQPLFQGPASGPVKIGFPIEGEGETRYLTFQFRVTSKQVE